MNQVSIGKFIARKRKEKNLTQEQLAEILSVSNKTISKWETGKCMPDYSIIQKLCEELEISIAELIDGEEQVEKSIRVYDEEQTLDLIGRIRKLENQNTILSGFLYLSLSTTLGSIAEHIKNTSAPFRIIVLIVSIVSVVAAFKALLYALKSLTSRTEE